ncbi:MAG: hypothetical protein U1F26_06575 [Lysobacterales bacterium]
MIQKLIGCSVLALGLAAAAPVLHAAPEMAKPAHLAANTEGFLQYHPDLRWRKEGLQRMEDGKAELAFEAFMRSAKYADKGSQAMIGEMYWKGEGVTVDRPRAYAWMDLAAERGYRDFLTLREHYWLNLSEREREQALKVGADIYAEFGDDVAKPRLEKVIDRGRRQATGSRTGFRGALTVLIPGNGDWISIDAEQYYNDRYWQPDQYFQWQDQIWRDTERGRVEVGALSTEDGTKPATQE